MTLNLRGELFELSRPAVMGIINLTSDSFYASSRVAESDLAAVTEMMLSDGADILDLGACSTRPGSRAVSEEEELRRLLPAVIDTRRNFPKAIISVDTFRSRVARECIEAGADIVNDISGGDADPEMARLVADLKVPYIVCHSRGDSASMNDRCDYEDVAADVLRSLAFKIDALRQTGVCDVIADPGFGFSKTTDQNFRLLGALGTFKNLGCPILAGVSRKRMIQETAPSDAAGALNGTTAANMIALMRGADILRVHDVREAAECVRIYEAYRRNLPEPRIVTTTFGDGKRQVELY